jgi:hypothetical protein
MQKYNERLSNVSRTINLYKDLRSIFMKFIATFPDAIQNIALSASARAIDDMKVEVSTIDSKVEIYFDYVITKSDVFGVIKCDEVVADERELLFANYFDWEGRTYFSPGDGNPLQTLAHRHYPEYLVLQIYEAQFARHTQSDVEGR